MSQIKTRSIVDQQEEYEPYKHRESTYPLTYFEALMNMIKASVGVGLINMPYQFMTIGLIGGYVMGFFCGFVFLLGTHMLIRTQYLQCKKLRVPVITYAESIKDLFKVRGKMMFFCSVSLDCMMILQQIYICGSYIVYIAVYINLRGIYEEFFSLNMVQLMMLLPLVPLCLVRSLKFVTPLSAAGLILTFAAIACASYIFITDMPHISKIKYMGKVSDLPTTMHGLGLALSTINVALIMYNNMKNPRLFTASYGVLNISYIFNCVINLGFGFVGYWRFYEHIDPDVGVNLVESHRELSIAMSCLYGIALYLSIGLQVYPVIVAILCYKNPSRDNPHMWENAVRLGCAVLIILASFVLLHLIQFVWFLASMVIYLLNCIIPGLIDVFVRWPEKNFGKCFHIMFQDIFIITCGFVGVFCTLYDLIDYEIKR